MTRADLKHCGKIPDAREELNRSVREERIESIHSIKSLEGMGSSFCFCFCIILEISSLLSKNYPGSQCARVMDI